MTLEEKIRIKVEKGEHLDSQRTRSQRMTQVGKEYVSWKERRLQSEWGILESG